MENLHNYKKPDRLKDSLSTWPRKQNKPRRNNGSVSVHPHMLGWSIQQQFVSRASSIFFKKWNSMVQMLRELLVCFFSFSHFPFLRSRRLGAKVKLERENPFHLLLQQNQCFLQTFAPSFAFPLCLIWPSSQTESFYFPHTFSLPCPKTDHKLFSSPHSYILFCNVYWLLLKFNLCHTHECHTMLRNYGTVATNFLWLTKS